MNIWGYVIRRLLYIVPMVIGITAITFFTVFAAAGNPVAIVEANDPELPQATLNALINYLQLNRPPAIQYLNWLWNVVHLNFGVSIQSGRPVSDIIWSWAWTTIYLQLAALAVSVALAIPISVYAAKRRNSLGDFVITGVSVFGISAPVFWVGEMLIILFAYDLGILPAGGAHSLNAVWPWSLGDYLAHLVLPAAVIAYFNLGLYVRLLRSRLVEIMQSDYIMALKAMGTPERITVYKHALRNAITPVVTFVGLALGTSIAGAPVTETTFSWPGLGYEFVRAITNLDFPVILAIVFLISVMTMVSNIAVDILYVYIDPRVRVS